jgi:hypothetical protein
MSEKIVYGIAILSGTLSLALLIADVALIEGNRQLQNDVTQRQSDIGKGASITQLNQNLIQALADAAVGSNDTAIKDLLAAQGITVKPKGAAGAASGDNKSPKK